MPIKESAIKALRQSDKRASKNRARKRIMHDAIKRLNEFIHDKKKDDATSKLVDVHKAIDKAQKNGVIKKNTAARKKSRLTKAVNAIK